MSWGGAIDPLDSVGGCPGSQFEPVLRPARLELALAARQIPGDGIFYPLMYLSRVTIKNYRSIKELEVRLDPRCRILVGINESGKTNILDALNLLDPKASSTRRDLREPGLREEPIKEAHVRFIYSFTKEETSEIAASVKKNFLSKTYKNPIITTDGAGRTLDQLCESREGLYVANILTGKKNVSVWSLGKAQITSNWRKVGSACPADFLVQRGSDNIPLSEGMLVDASEFKQFAPTKNQSGSLLRAARHLPPAKAHVSALRNLRHSERSCCGKSG